MRDGMFDSLVESIYNAASDETLWSTVVEKFARSTGAQGGILYGTSKTLDRMQFEFNGGLDLDCNRRFRENHIGNPLTARMAQQPLGKLVVSEEIVNFSSFKKTEFYNEVLRPQRVAHDAMARVMDGPNLMGALTLCRSAQKGPYTDDERRQQERLIPHIQRALALGMQWQGYKALHDVSRQMLDRIGSGIVLLDAQGSVVIANRAALSALSDTFHISSLGIRVRIPAQQSRFAAALGAIRGGAAFQLLKLPRLNSDRSLTIYISSIQGNDLQRFATLGWKRAVTMIFISDPLRSNAIERDHLMALYPLTSAEARVAVAASQDVSVAQIAKHLKLSKNTVKTHLRRVYEKMGIRHQTELVRLLQPLHFFYSI